jgi:hypothetical protein
VSNILNLGDRRERRLFLFLRDTIFRLDYFLHKGFYDWIRGWFSRVQKFFNRSGEERSVLVRKKLGDSNARIKDRNLVQNPAATARTEDEGDLAWQDYDRHMREHFDTVNEAVKCYIPCTYPGRIVLFRSSVGYRRPEMRMADPMMGWERIAKGGLEMFVVQGNHLQIVREPNVKSMGERLRISLEQVQLSLSNRAGNNSASSSFD